MSKSLPQSEQPRRITPTRAGAITVAAAAIIYGVTQVEGAFVNHPSDPGGATNHGITEAVARADGYTGRMQDLPKERAISIYNRQYVERPGFTAIVERCEAESLLLYVGHEGNLVVQAVKPSLGWEVVDTGVNAGTGRAARWFQESLNHFNERGRLFPDIAVDGQIGPGTIAAFDRLIRRRGRAVTCEVMRKAVDSKQAAHYARLFGQDSKFEDFAWGWFRTRIGEKDGL